MGNTLNKFIQKVEVAPMITIPLESEANDLVKQFEDVLELFDQMSMTVKIAFFKR